MLVPVKLSEIPVTEEQELMPMDEALSILLNGDVTPKRVDGLLKCLVFDDEEPLPNFQEQVGMTPEEFRTKFASVLNHEDPFVKKTVDNIVRFVDKMTTKGKLSQEECDHLLSCVKVKGKSVFKILQERKNNL